MALCRFEYQGLKQLGRMEGNRVFPLGYLDLIDYLEDENPASIETEALDLRDVTLLAPMDRPLRNVICLGKNYLDHVREVGGLSSVGSELPQKPIYFTKAVSTIRGPQDEVPAHGDISSAMDYETELVLVIGKQVSNLTPENAQEAIFGYLIGNDFSARDLQTEHNQWFKGKSLDGHTALSALVIEKEEMEYPPKREIRCFVNGELRQTGNTQDMIFDLTTILVDLTRGMTLFPGDLIFTGTPSGVGAGFQPPRYLKAGDEVRCEIDGLGELVNHVGS